MNPPWDTPIPVNEGENVYEAFNRFIMQKFSQPELEPAEVEIHTFGLPAPVGGPLTHYFEESYGAGFRVPGTERKPDEAWKVFFPWSNISRVVFNVGPEIGDEGDESQGGEEVAGAGEEDPTLRDGDGETGLRTGEGENGESLRSLD